MAESFRRPPQGFPFQFGGMKLNAKPNQLPPNKYALALNVRGALDDSIQTRPGQFIRFATGGQPITDMRAYAALSTDNLPRILARDAQDRIYLDNATLKGTLAGGGAALGASMLPFRPNASPTPYMYVANGSDYQKFSAPAANVVVMQKVGIAEPQAAPDAHINDIQFGNIGDTLAANWTAGGTAAAPVDTVRVADVIPTSFFDPAAAPTTGDPRTLQVSSAKSYQPLMDISGTTGGGARNFMVTDVFPPLSVSLTIAAIYYFSGTTGRCIIVPTYLGGTALQSIYLESFVYALRRGSLIKIGTEVCYVWSVTVGPDGTICIETSTTGAHTTAEALTGVPAVQVIGGVLSPTALNAPANSYQVTVGIGTQTETIGANPFALAGLSFGSPDYISIGVQADNLANLIELRIMFDVGDGTFTQNYYYYSVRPSDITSALANTVTQLAAAQTAAQLAEIDAATALVADSGQESIDPGTQLAPGALQWTQIVFPLNALTRVGSDDTLTLQNLTKIRLQWNASGTINVQQAQMMVFGSYALDVGDAGAPYLYRVRPRSSITGAVGNPSPQTRYGINPRRMRATVHLPSAAYDTQIDTWDIFRYGGSVTSWRYIGSTPSTNTTFTDNFGDEAAGVGAPLDFDNMEPWPSIGLPNNNTATSIVGTIAIVTSTDTRITSYLPGTLIQLGGQNVYTLWARPTLIGGTSYLLQLVENAGFGTNVPFRITEPIIANQKLPYMWGPDANGTVFAVGDPLRPGTLYFAKNYAPDSAPDSYNIEITPPSEPLLGGEVIDGLSYVASSERWWALIPQPDNPAQRFNVRQEPMTRGLGAPFGHCNDGKTLYWWAKDSIQSSAKGSLTDADLYNLFPHGDVQGTPVTVAGVTIQPPAYKAAGTFRLTHSNGYLYAIYQDTVGTYHCLVYDIRRDAWSVDDYSPDVSCFYHVEQQAGTVLSSSTLYPYLYSGNIAGQVAEQSVNTDISGVIVCAVQTFEFDGGDQRAPKQWGDLFLDVVPYAGTGSTSPPPVALTVTPVSQGAAIAPASTIPTSLARQRTPVAVGLLVSDFLGLLLQWSDDNSGGGFTQLHAWQPSYAVQPARLIAFQTFGADLEMSGYGHMPYITLAWVSTTPITLTITVYDGLSPAVLTIPSSGGQYRKQLFRLTPNKGLLYNIAASSTAPFQIFLDDCEVVAGQWGREGPYAVFKDFGEKAVDSGVI
jgi:hypothetical protein